MPTTVTDVVRRLITEAWTGRNVALVDELVAADYVEHAPFGEIRGIDGYKEGIATFVGAFGPLTLTIEDMLAERDRVATRFTFRGRHVAEFMGVPASGSEVTMPAIDICRLEGGKVAEEWLSVDMLGLLQQIGATPAASGVEPGPDPTAVRIAQ